MKKQTKQEAGKLTGLEAFRLTDSKMLNLKGGFNPQPDPPGRSKGATTKS
jgi:hypothetical protein